MGHMGNLITSTSGLSYNYFDKFVSIFLLYERMDDQQIQTIVAFVTSKLYHIHMNFQSSFIVIKPLTVPDMMHFSLIRYFRD